MEWTAPLKPAELTETRLVDAILDGVFPIGSNLPGERELAAQLKVTRPTLREALQRLERDGWLEIHQGKATRVKDYWHEGNLGVLGALARYPQHTPNDFIPNLLAVRLAMAPAYTHLAVEHNPAHVLQALQSHQSLPDEPQAFASFDWNLHYQLTIASGNPIFTLILNGFSSLYPPMACRYFDLIAARNRSRQFYQALRDATRAADAQAAEAIVSQVMADSMRLWHQANSITK